MKKLTLIFTAAIALLCAGCDGGKEVKYYDAPEGYEPTVSPIIVAPTEPPTDPNGETGPLESLEFETQEPISPDETPLNFIYPQDAIRDGIEHKYEGSGTEEVNLGGFKLLLGEHWIIDNTPQDKPDRIIEGPVRYITDDGASIIMYVQANDTGWDATDEAVNKGVANALMNSADTYVPLDDCTIDTPLGKGLMVYYKLINTREEGAHNQRACLVMVPVGDKVLSISAGAYDSNEDVVFNFAFRAIGQVLGSVEADTGAATQE